MVGAEGGAGLAAGLVGGEELLDCNGSAAVNTGFGHRPTKSDLHDGVNLRVGRSLAVDRSSRERRREPAGPNLVSLTYWREAVDQWDALLLMRVGKLRRERNQASDISGVAVYVASFLVLFLLRSITQPLGSLVRELGPGSTAMRMSMEKLAVDQVRPTHRSRANETSGGYEP